MSVRNFICETCCKRRVCAVAKKIYAFSDEVKKPLCVDITMDSCIEYIGEEDCDGA